MKCRWRWIVALVFCQAALCPELNAQDSFSGGSSSSSGPSGSSSGGFGSSGGSLPTGGASSGFGFGGSGMSGSATSTTTPSPGTGSSSSGSSLFGTPPPSSSSNPFSGGTPASPSSGSSSSFGSTPSPFLPRPSTGSPVTPGVTPPGGVTFPGSPGATPGTGPSSTFSTPETTPAAAPIPTEAAPSFTLPAAYGGSSQTFTLGEGRFARPRTVWNFSTQLGFDDNVFASPTDPQGIPDQVVRVQTDPGAPAVLGQREITVTRPRRTSGGGIVLETVPTGRFTTFVITPAREPEFEDVVFPGVEPQEKIASVIYRVGGGFEAQFANRRQLFTIDINANADYNFDRPQDKIDYNGNFAFTFIQKLSPRLQFSANANLAYLSQPDFSQINGPVRQVGDYLIGSTKADMSYRWSKRFSTVSSVSFSTTRYSQAAQEGNNYLLTTFGTEGRYLWSPRLTLLADIRFNQASYDTEASRDSSGYVVLLGAEFAYSRRLTGTLRLGQATREFASGGEQKTAPYLEATAAYRVNPAGVIQWSSRFGFEEPDSASTSVQVFRTSLTWIQAFSARLRGSASVNFIHRITSFDGGGEDIVEDTADCSLGLEYAVSRRFSLTGNYTFTNVMTEAGISDYYRNRIFLGAQYTF